MNKIINALAAWAAGQCPMGGNHDWVPWSGKQRCRKCGTTA